MWRRSLTFFIVTVITSNAYATHGQSYFLAVEQNSHGYYDRELLIRDSFGNNSSSSSIDTSAEEVDDKNSTIIVIKTTVQSNSSELSQTTMDVITIIWYVATFLALAAFFVLMVCSDRRCGRARRAVAIQNSETPHAPPTPSPSYSEFAPPSYESVVKIHGAPSVYVIPFPIDEHKDDNINGIVADGQTTTTSVVTFYTVNESHKLGS